jgi:lipopolysaccharide/colanic/teichoic acid biosynthesis glycosyltransferase
VLLDVGMPLLFWQERIGQGGRRFLLYKFRTLRAPFDHNGNPVPEQRRLSVVGRLLRQSRLDELPQVLNMLVGDMSLIGPRPLLPADQPNNPTTRLMVRPGITGWAQVNGGKFLTPAQKDEYDEYYIRHASPWFDLRIIWLTLKVIFRVGRHSDHAVAALSTVGFGVSGQASGTAETAVRISDMPPSHLPQRPVHQLTRPVAQPERSNG